jgi:hypothetical protein
MKALFVVSDLSLSVRILRAKALTTSFLFNLVFLRDQSTQEKDIARAKEYWEDYRSRDDRGFI